MRCNHSTEYASNLSSSSIFRGKARSESGDGHKYGVIPALRSSSVSTSSQAFGA